MIMEWTHWTKALPPDDSIVILCNKSEKKSFLGYYKMNSGCFFKMNGDGVRVSHWMPLPEPPKQ